MHINLINKKLYFNNYRLKCAIGKRGISNKKKEGDYCTPKGILKFKAVFYRKDRVPKIKTQLKKVSIKKNMGWCDEPKSKSYNKLVKFLERFKFDFNNICTIRKVMAWGVFYLSVVW